jgi:ABC-type phosphate/phosphonate transport system substrate-binding protein
MVKFAHMLVLSALIVWLAGSGCVGNGTSEIEKSGVDPNAVEAGNGAPAEDLEMGLTPVEIQELDSDMEELEDLLENASPEEEIEIEEL